MNPTLLRVTQRIIERSKETRSAYLARIEQAKTNTVHRSQLACGNLAHGFAACQPEDKASLKSMLRNNIAIITSYNDMLSAHQPYEVYPDIIRKALHSVNAVGQVAGGVPAMCDGVTQGQDGMELSLLSREVIAMSAAVGLSHNMFDGALYLGVCDKIVPGLAMAALQSHVDEPMRTLLLFGGFMIFNFMTNLGPNAQTYLLAGEVFPTHIRGKGAGFAAAFAKIGAVLTAFAFPVVLAEAL